MRNLASDPTLNLFPPDGLVAEADEIQSQQDNEGKTPDKLARDFVKWCSSFGLDFRNSPDLGNLSYWAKKQNINLKPSEEGEVLTEARRLMLKKIEQTVRKADAPPPPLVAAPAVVTPQGS